MLTWSLRNIRIQDFKYRNRTLKHFDSEEVKNEGKMVHSTVFDMKNLLLMTKSKCLQ